MTLFRFFIAIAWLYLISQAFLVMAAARDVSLYPPFKDTISITAGLSYALTWLLVLFVFRRHRQGGFIPWIIALYGLLSLVEPLIEISRSDRGVILLRATDGYTWFRFLYSGFAFIVIIALFSVTSPPLIRRTRWIAIGFLVALITPFLLDMATRHRVPGTVMAYAPLADLLPVLFIAVLFRTSERERTPALQPDPDQKG